MKTLKLVGIFSVLLLAVGSCFDPPEFPVEPQIDLKGIYFGVSADRSDSIVLSISFKDGDGDLGLSTELISYPFNARNYFLKNNGQLIPVPTFSPYSDVGPLIYLEDQVGKLATIDVITDPLYEDQVPSYVYPYTCNTYIFDTLYVQQGDERIIDGTYNITDTLTSPGLPSLYEIREIWYTEKNPNYDNITVDFEIRNPDGSYTFLDWETITGSDCSTSFNGRFPVLSEKEGPLDGILHYSMKSEGFIYVLSSKTFRLKIKIKDRALHVSNEIITADYTLDQLRQ